MTSKLRLVLVLAGVVAAALPAGGCGGNDYQQEELGLDGPVAGQIDELLADLRGSGQGQLDRYMQRHAASDLPAERRDALAAALRMLRQRDIELRKLDRFGADVVRAGFALGENASMQWMLLVKTDGQWKWAGPN